ncbi:Hypothetical_protein [Hexamita inflata]|uniref:Hypothetical_protein n=1 Tax=Hexamita inflata TaxID=28002 RepID=A0AA86UQT8_9EUKA|nr:Hypothetical protein HINF_LOCUS52049 [Hexamita inflata]
MDDLVQQFKQLNRIYNLEIINRYLHESNQNVQNATNAFQNKLNEFIQITKINTKTARKYLEFEFDLQTAIDQYLEQAEQKDKYINEAQNKSTQIQQCQNVEAKEQLKEKDKPKIQQKVFLGLPRAPVKQFGQNQTQIPIQSPFGNQNVFTPPKMEFNAPQFNNSTNNQPFVQQAKEIVCIVNNGFSTLQFIIDKLQMQQNQLLSNVQMKPLNNRCVLSFLPVNQYYDQILAIIAQYIDSELELVTRQNQEKDAKIQQMAKEMNQIIVQNNELQQKIRQYQPFQITQNKVKFIDMNFLNVPDQIQSVLSFMNQTGGNTTVYGQTISIQYNQQIEQVVESAVSQVLKAIPQILITKRTQ